MQCIHYDRREGCQICIEAQHASEEGYEAALQEREKIVKKVLERMRYQRNILIRWEASTASIDQLIKDLEKL